MKESVVFPEEWISATVLAVRNHQKFARCESLLVAAVPVRPGRICRLEAFLALLEASGRLADCHVAFAPDLLEFSEGVLSNHCDKLGAAARSANFRGHLFLKRPELLAARPNALVIDDVATTGATLFHAKRCLQRAGAGRVVPLAMALTVNRR